MAEKALAGFEGGGRGLLAKECEQPLEAEKGREMDSLLEPPEKLTLSLKL